MINRPGVSVSKSLYEIVIDMNWDNTASVLSVLSHTSLQQYDFVRTSCDRMPGSVIPSGWFPYIRCSRRIAEKSAQRSQLADGAIIQKPRIET